MTRSAVYAGSFDPLTNGHVDIVERGRSVFDRVIVAVARNEGKDPLFTTEERVEMAREVLKDTPNLRVDSYDGMTVDYVHSVDASMILRGIRTISDFEYEFQMALTNSHFADDIEMVFMMTSNEYAFLSSHFIKEVVALGGDASAFVPPFVEQRLKERLLERKT